MRKETFSMTKDRRTEECQNCPLCKSELRVVATEYGSKPVRVMFIAEAPGREENSQGRPAIGPTGKILRRLVQRLNGGDDGIAYGNVVRCRPTVRSTTKTEDGAAATRVADRKPTEAEIGYCRHFLYSDIERLDPQYIVLLGDVATHALAIDPRSGEGVDKKKGIHQLRGKDYVVRTPSGKEYPATATFHFAYISRNLYEAGVFAEDIQKAFWRTRKDYVDYSQRGKPAVILDTIPKVKKLLYKLRYGLTKDDIVALDFETTGLNRINAKLLCIGFAYGPDKGYVIPYEHKDTPWSVHDLRKLKRMFARFFSASDFSFGAMIAHNLKFEAAVIMDVFGVVPLDVPWECTLLRANTLNENRGGSGDREEGEKGKGGYGLKTLVEEWLSFYHYHDKDLEGTVEKRNKDKLAKASFVDLANYNAMDCYVEWRLYAFEDYYATRTDYDLEVFHRLHRKLLGPSSIFASWLERNGMSVNKGRLRFLIGAKSPILTSMRRIERELYARSSTKAANRLMLGQSKTTQKLQPLWSDGHDTWVFSISKPAARRTLLIDVLKLTAGKKASGKEATKNGQWRVNKNFYTKYAGNVEVDLIAEWMGFDKLYGTYIKGIYDKLQNDPDMKVDGRVRGRLNLANTVTGRTSFDNPNLQNIPRGKTEDAKGIKRLFNSPKRRMLVCGDYSQAEVRWLAEITKDKKLITEFRKVAEIIATLATDPTPENVKRAKLEGDFHRRTASQVFKTPLEAVTKVQRSSSKELVFGIIYGMGIASLATKISNSTKTEVTQEDAEKFWDAFLAQFPTAAEWLTSIEHFAYKNGYVESPFGRRRHLTSYFLVPQNVANAHWKKRTTDTLSPQEQDLEMFLGQESRQARNSPIQSVASDTNLLACIKLMRYIVENGKDWKLVNVVHDSIIAEIPVDEVDAYTSLAKATMQDGGLFLEAFSYKARTPFVADFSAGPNWGDQYDVLGLPTWQIKCKTLIKTKKDGKKVKVPCGEHDVYVRRQPKMCPACNGTEISVEYIGGPVPSIMKQIRADKRASRKEKRSA